TNLATSLSQKTMSDTNGKFNFKVKNHLKYGIIAQKDLYQPEAKEIDLNNAVDQIYNTEVYLNSYKDVEEKVITDNGVTKLVINPIYFDFNKWNIRPDAAIELDEVVKMMEKYPTLKIEVEAHTDCRGSNAYNLELSKKRAKSVMDYLILRGISKENLTSIGYGETQPVNQCTREGICTDEEYSVNRRCEFIIKN
ncbi:MAG TPA: OmpA family protein, partial [Flavobacteriaceae bacterium]|nr:OmpA family protein [Flavobacteriaceae bacterium]